MRGFTGYSFGAFGFVREMGSYSDVSEYVTRKTSGKVEMEKAVAVNPKELIQPGILFQVARLICYRSLDTEQAESVKSTYRSPDGTPPLWSLATAQVTVQLEYHYPGTRSTWQASIQVLPSLRP